MKAIAEEEKSSTVETVANSIDAAPPMSPRSKPVPVQARSLSTSSTSRSASISSRVSTAGRMSLSGLDPMAVNKSLQSQLEQWKEMYHKEQRDMQHRIDTLEQENSDLLQEQDILNDRHQSHTEELRYMQNEFLCIKGHLQKLRNEMENLDGLLIEQQLRQQQQKMSREEHQMAEKVEEAIFKVKERQEFTCVFMDNTISSIDEILNEYIPDKIEYKVVEDHKTKEELIQEAELRQMREEEDLRRRLELERQLMEQLAAAQAEAPVPEGGGDAQGSDFTSSSSQLGNSASSLFFQLPEEHLSELGIETPAAKEAKLSQEARNLFKEQQKMFAQYIEESRSDAAAIHSDTSVPRFKGWFEEKRDKWKEEEGMKELRRKKRQSHAQMMHKVKEMHSKAFHEVTELKLQHHEEEEAEKERRSMVGKEENGGSEKATSMAVPALAPVPVTKPAEAQGHILREEELRFSMNKDLNDYFKQYKDAKSDLLNTKSGETRQGGGGLFSMVSMVFGDGGKAESELSC